MLARDGSLSRAEAERRRLVLAQAQANADAARNHVAALQTQVDRLHPDSGSGTAAMVSPIEGIVVTIGVTPGELIDTTTNGFTVADLSVVVALAQVPETNAALLKMGDHADVRLASGGSRSWSGRVAALGASLDAQARTLQVRITLDNKDAALRAGMFVEVTITSVSGRDDTTVPAAAVQLVGDKRVAFTPVGGDKFRSHVLTLGVERPDWVEVRQGLNPGDEVVTDGSFTLKSLLQQAMLGGGG